MPSKHFRHKRREIQFKLYFIEVKPQFYYLRKLKYYKLLRIRRRRCRALNRFQRHVDVLQISHQSVRQILKMLIKFNIL